MKNGRTGRGRIGVPRGGISARLATVFGVVAAAVAIVVPHGPASAATITVTNTSDNAVFDEGCSLREAIINANTDSQAGSTECAPGSGADTIVFSIPGPGPHLIQLQSPLPVVTDPVTIDGYTEPGSAVNTLDQGSNAVLRVGITNGGAVEDGLVLAAAGSTVRGLAITGFSSGAGVLAIQAANIYGNFIGVGFDGTTPGPNAVGVEVNGEGIEVGGFQDADANVISSNVEAGVSLTSEAFQTFVAGNLIGTDASGTTGVGNFIGVRADGFDDVITSNVISGNLTGMQINGANVVVRSNRIGTDATGNVAVPNAEGGIFILDDAVNAQIGGLDDGGNTISGNTGDGIAIFGTGGIDAQIVSNRIGLAGEFFDQPLGNVNGIGVYSSGVNTITIGTTLAGNDIAHNANAGVAVLDGTGASIVGNFVFSNGAGNIVLDGNPGNDPGDVDTGPNNYQNHPELLEASQAGDDVIVDYVMDSDVGASAYPITVHWYAVSPDSDAVTWFFTSTVAAPGPQTTNLGESFGGGVLTATATDANGNTSEFAPTLDTTGSGPTNKLGSSDPRGLFGDDVDAWGDFLLVGEPGDGAVGQATLLFLDTEGFWNEVQTFDENALGFGTEVAIEGDLIAIGQTDGDAPRTTIYRRPGLGLDYVEVATLPDTGDLDISDGMLLIGDPEGRGDSGIPNAKVYDLLGNLDDLVNRVQQVFFAPFPYPAGYATEVALHYDRATDTGTLAIGSPGAARVDTFSKQTGVVWDVTPLAVLPSPDSDDDLFGADVAISADHLVVGEPVNDTAAPDAGAIWVYARTGSGFDAPQRFVASDATDGNQFGDAVAIDGDTIVVGSPAANELGVPFRAGAAYRFAGVDGTWVEREIYRAADGDASDFFGLAVAVDGENIAVGAPGQDDFGDEAGAVYTFRNEAEDTGDVGLDFDITLAAGSSSSLDVAPAGIAANLLDRNALVSRDQASSSVAASSITAVGPRDTAIAGINLGATPLSAIVLDSDSLSAIPLVNIDIEGGWARVIAGTDLENVPLANLTFGRVLASGSPTDPDSAAGRVAGTPLSAIDVEGTPLSAIPLSAIALGATPLSAIPLSAIGDSTTQWCTIVAPIEPNCDEALLAELTLMEVTLRGVPLSAIPLSAIPLSAIDLSASPLSAIPLSAINLSASPLSAIPLSAIPLSAIDVQGTPLSAIPLSAIPLSAIPLSAIPLSAIDVQGTPLSAIPLSAIDVNGTPLSAIPTSIPLSAIPLSAIDVNGTPLSAIEVQGAPLSAIPLSAIVLADTPLSAIPLSAIGTTDWCAVLAAEGFNCGTGVDPATTTLRELSVRGVPLSAIPLSAIPLSAIDVAGAPLSAIPLSAIPLSAIPLSAIPLSAIDVAGTPLSAIPLSAIDVQGSPLSAIPLSAIDVAGTPLSAIPLSAIPLSAIPLSAIPLSAIDVAGSPLSAIPLSAIDVIGSPLSAIPLSAIPLSAIGVDCERVDCVRGTVGDAWRASAIPATTTLEALQTATGGIRVGELVLYLIGAGIDDVTVLADDRELTLADLTTFDDMTLGDLPRGLDALTEMLLGDLGGGLNTVTFADLLGLVDAAGTPIADLDVLLRDAIDAREQTLGDLDSLGDVTLGELLDGGPALTLADIAPLLGFLTVDTIQRALGIQIPLGNASIGDLTADELGQLTLADLADLPETGALTIEELLGELGADRLAGFTLGDLLLALVDPSSLALGPVQFDEVNVTALPAGTVPPARFTATFTLAADDDAPVDITVALPSSASYVPGTAVQEVGGVSVAVEPSLAGTALSWTIVATPGEVYEISFDVAPALQLGATPIGGTARVVGTDVVATAVADVTVREGIEPNDFLPVAGSPTLRETTPALDDVVYLTYIPSPTDIDVFELELDDNDRLVVELSNLDADLDVALWRRPAGTTVGKSLSPAGTEPPLFPIVDPDAIATDAEPLADFPRLDQLDPSVQLVAVSNGSGLVNEYLSTGRLLAGTYFIQVYGVNGATTVQPATLQLRVIDAGPLPACRAIDLPTVSTPFPTIPTIPGDANTLILLNATRIEQLYGLTGRSTVLDAVDDLTAYLASADGLPLGVRPAVVPVDGNAAVRAAYAQWDSLAGSCDVEAANAVVAAINTELIDPVRDQIEHIMILGTDEVIPMARVSDRTQIANEYDYRHEFDGDLVGGAGRNSFTSSFWSSTVKTDEPYGEAAARSLGDRFLYVSDVALGRVVETPDEIADALRTFVDFDGTLAVETGAVLGYDFLVDGSEEVAAELAESGLPIDDEFVDGFGTDGEAWDESDATTAVAAAGTNALISLNAHFDHYRALPAIGDKVPGFEDNLIASTLADELGAGADLVQTLLFSMGCHSGLSVSDVLVGTTNADWAQVLGREGALYVGNTGFGYGDTTTVAYTEELMRLFARQLVSPIDRTSIGSTDSSIGQALTWAKNEFFAANQTFSVYDEKALMESTFYGVPFYRVGLTPEPLPAPPVNVTSPDATGTEALRTDVSAENEAVSTGRGTYYRNVVGGEEQVIVAPGRPIQPKTITDVSVVSPTDPSDLALVARGAMVLDLTSTYVPLADPVIATPVFDEAVSQPEPATGDGAFPTKPLALNTVTTPAGTRQQLVVATGQYDAATSTQRLDDEIDVVVYYASPDEPDTTVPTIARVESSVIGGRLVITVTAADLESDVDRVYALVVQNPGSAGAFWTGFDLGRAPGTDRWSGSLTLAPATTGVEFLVQVKDGAGNVGVSTNKAGNFIDDLQPAPAPPAPPAAVLAVDAPAPPPSGVFGGPVTIDVLGSTTATTYFVDDVERGTFPTSGGSFQITGDGPHTWRVITITGHERSGFVVIDSTDPTPLVDRAAGPVPVGSELRLSGADAGTGIATIVYSVSGATTIPPTQVGATSVLVTLAAAGITTVTLQVVDGAGNVSAPVEFVYEVIGSAPVVTAQLSSPPNAAGWHNTPVEVTWNVDDPAATVPPPVAVTGEGALQEIVSEESCNAAGLCATGSVVLNIDLTAPDASIATAPEAGNEFGWNAEPVTVTVTCGPDLSGVVCPDPVVIGDDITGQVVSVSVSDVAGNVTSLASREINIDTVPPVITWNAPPDGSTIDETDFLRPTCFATDERSGVNGSCSVEVSEPVTTPGFAEYTATATASDRAGNESSLTSTFRVRTDLAGPVVTVTAAPEANDAGWWNGPVTFTFECEDPSGVTSCPDPVTVSTQGANQSFEVVATDVAGNDTPLNVSGINIDTVAPAVTVSVPATVGPLDTVEITCSATDALSGIATADCADATFPAAELEAGPNTFTFSATDAAGNTTVVTRVITLEVDADPAPVVLADMGVAGLEEIGFQSGVAIITGSFIDPTGPGPFTAAVQWFEGGPFTRLVLNDGSRFVAANIYPRRGTYTVTVRVCDAGGACGTDEIVVHTRVRDRVRPVRECVVDRGAGTSPRYEARWGYDNPAPFAIYVPTIPLFENTFTRVPFLRGQPQVFLAGSQRDVFTTPFSSGTQSWRLNGTTASATSGSPRC